MEPSTQTIKPVVYQAPTQPKKTQARGEKPLGVLMGQTGVGKTTLLNKLCGTNETAGAAMGSVTRRLFKSLTSAGASFEVIDTPGIDSKQETYKHVYLIREALTVLPINTIFIVIKYDSRFDNIFSTLLKVQEAVYKYESKIVVLVSHWDQSKNPTQDSKAIGDLLKDCCAGVIFYSENSPANEISQLMYDFMSTMDKTDLKIETEDFFLNFNVYEIRNEMMRSYFKFQKDIDELEKSFNFLVTDAKGALSQDELDDFLHSLIVCFREETDELLNNFITKHSDGCESLENYTFYIKMQKESVKRNASFSSKTSQHMSYDLNDGQDPRNLIKKCPHCQRIWFKTEGCDGMTTCGNITTSVWDVLAKPFRKFKFSRKADGSFEFKKVDLGAVKKSDSQQKKQLPHDWHKSSDGKDAIGCKKGFIWKDQPKLEEEIITEIFQVKDLEEIKQLLKKDTFIKFKNDYNAQIDATLYTQ